eukprot:7256718-Prymnesium_polylepis.1
MDRREKDRLLLARWWHAHGNAELGAAPRWHRALHRTEVGLQGRSGVRATAPCRRRPGPHKKAPQPLRALSSPQRARAAHLPPPQLLLCCPPALEARLADKVAVLAAPTRAACLALAAADEQLLAAAVDGAPLALAIVVVVVATRHLLA